MMLFPWFLRLSPGFWQHKFPTFGCHLLTGVLRFLASLRRYICLLARRVFLAISSYFPRFWLSIPPHAPLYLCCDIPLPRLLLLFILICPHSSLMRPHSKDISIHTRSMICVAWPSFCCPREPLFTALFSWQGAALFSVVSRREAKKKLLS